MFIFGVIKQCSLAGVERDFHGKVLSSINLARVTKKKKENITIHVLKKLAKIAYGLP